MPYKDTNKRKEYMKAWLEANKDSVKAYRQAHKEERKAYTKAYYQAHKEERQEYSRKYYKANKEQVKEQTKEYKKAHKEECKAYMKSYLKSYMKSYREADINSLGESKSSIRSKSQRYLNKYGTKIKGYQIHHCCTYTEPYKFIYCSREMHKLIHNYLKQHNIDADSNHYEQIKHLLDENVVLYNI